MVQVSKNRKVRKPTRKAAHDRRSKEVKAKKRSRVPDRNGFLKQSFIPVTDKVLPDSQSIEKMMVAFETSFRHLGELYKFTPINLYQAAFPVNIYNALQHAEKYIKSSDKAAQLLVVKDEEAGVSLVTAKPIQPVYDLYYVQAEPLYRMVSGKKRRPLTDLLLCIFAYLYQVANMPFCNEQFIGDTYDMLEEWIENDPESWDAEDYKKRLKELKKMNRDAERMRKSIAEPLHLEAFERRINAFLPESETEAETGRLATSFFLLWKEYPGHSYNSNVIPNLLNPEMEERMYMEQYFSFVWECKGWLFEDLIDNVNISLQEYCICDEPTAIQFFDQPQESIRLDLSFENRLLKLVEELVDILNTL